MNSYTFVIFLSMFAQKAETAITKQNIGNRNRRSSEQLKPTTPNPHPTRLPKWIFSPMGQEIFNVPNQFDLFDSKDYQFDPLSSNRVKGTDDAVQKGNPIGQNNGSKLVDGSTVNHNFMTSYLAHVLSAAAAAVLIGALFVFLLFYFCKGRKPSELGSPKAVEETHSADSEVATNPEEVLSVCDKYDPASFEISSSNLEKGTRIGKGNFGEVFEAMLLLPLNNRSSFLNVFPKRKIPAVMKTPGNAKTVEEAELREKILKQEMKLMCNVGFHPNVVAMLGAVTRNTVGMFIVMEKCCKGNLSDFLISHKKDFVAQFDKRWNPFQTDTLEYVRPNGELFQSQVFLPVEYLAIGKKAGCKPDLSKNISTAHLLSFAMQIAQGMEYLHSIKCIHRDLAARNILLTSEGLCKIADFGLAKRLVYKEYYRTKTVHELPYRCMSIESLNQNVFTAESDIWSYGIVLYEIFSLGDLPYPYLDMNDIKNAVNSGIRNEQPKLCPDEIYHQMKLCWSVDKDQRPSFASSTAMMKKHLSAASKEIPQVLNEELKREVERQKLFEAIRRVPGNRRSLDIVPLSPLELQMNESTDL